MFPANNTPSIWEKNICFNENSRPIAVETPGHQARPSVFGRELWSLDYQSGPGSSTMIDMWSMTEIAGFHPLWWGAIFRLNAWEKVQVLPQPTGSDIVNSS